MSDHHVVSADSSSTGQGLIFAICPRCGQYNMADQTTCLFCREPLPGFQAGMRRCSRCDQALPISANRCPRCGMALPPLDLAPTTPPGEPGLWAQVGYVLLIALGGLMILGGAGWGILQLLSEGTVAEASFALALALVGAMFMWHSTRAFNPGRWRPLTLPSEWIWLGWVICIWGIGILVTAVLPEVMHRVLPLVIVTAAWLCSFLFLSATLHGLKLPVERQSLSGKLIPRHIVYLSFAFTAAFSTGLALMFEGIAAAFVGALMLLTAFFSGDTATYERLIRIADNPAMLSSVEDMIVTSPIVLAGLGVFLAICAPAIEEVLKGLPLLAFARNKSRNLFRRLDERTAILLGVAGGLGFAFAENVGYISMLAEEWALILWFRAGAAVMHGTASGFIGRAWYRGVVRGQWLPALLDVARGIGIHAMWNALALVIGWFSYKGMPEGILFGIVAGLLPLAILFTVLARWGIWVSEKA